MEGHCCLKVEWEHAVQVPLRAWQAWERVMGYALVYDESQVAEMHCLIGPISAQFLAPAAEP